MTGSSWWTDRDAQQLFAAGRAVRERQRRTRWRRAFIMGWWRFWEWGLIPAVRSDRFRASTQS